MLRQIIDLLATDKSRYFSITEFNNCLSFDHRVCFFNEYPWEANLSAIFTQERSRFPLRMSRILFAAKHSWTALNMSRPLFEGSFLQSPGGLSANEKK